ncbi:alpha/beta fold hydrolase [Chitinophaga sp. 30R24]|uniref:alpha/beta fold hydrolase n=1 Tax=Chitinophaga sp. 30R24 TaxID=3248838 RepID=UPI003B8EEB5B
MAASPISELPIAFLQEGHCNTSRHHSYYLQAGPTDGPLIIFVHGWPELGRVWQQAMQHFATQGYWVVAPDMRGYGESSVYTGYAAYAIEETVQDMLELLAYLGRSAAIWVGHDWGAPVVWGLASQHADKCIGVANLCVSYQPKGFAPANLIPLVNRNIYPEDQYPSGQWDYQLYYESHFTEVQKTFEADLSRTFRTLIRSGDPNGLGKPALSASITKAGGWFGGAGIAPDLPRDPVTLPEEELAAYITAYSRTGFFGPNAWYMNAALNSAYANRAPHNGQITIPVLFIHAAYDWICDTLHSDLSNPMRAACSQLSEATINCGHWIAQEKPAELNLHLENWIQQTLKL